MYLNYYVLVRVVAYIVTDYNTKYKKNSFILNFKNKSLYTYNIPCKLKFVFYTFYIL